MSDRVIGVVFDANLRLAKDGRPWLDHMKKAFRELVRKNLQDDPFYLYLPDCVDTTMNRGEQVAWIGNYSTDGSKFNLATAILQTMYVVDAEDEGEDYVRVVFYVTNRLGGTDKKSLEDLMMYREKERITSQFKTILVGEEADESVAKEVGLDFVQVTEPETLVTVVRELLEKCQTEVIDGND